ncbi:MAG: SLBB domain-containing protein [Nitrospinota bacterium]
MKVSDLFSEMNQPLRDAYLERADIVRTNDDLVTTTLVPVNLKKALAKIPGHDLRLAPLDKVIVYSIRDVEFKPRAEVAVVGAVQRPKGYTRSEKMTVKDLLLQAGGVLPNAYLKRADLLRYDFTKEVTTIIPINVQKAMEGRKSSDLLLKDRDLLRIYTIKERAFTPPHRVLILGAVQRPKEYIRSERMTVKDLLLKAGGVLPNAYLKRADLLRYDFTKEITTIIPINLEDVLAGDQTANIEMKDRDILRLFTLQERRYTPPHKLRIFGAVQRPGEYERSFGMRIRDLLFAAGDVTPGNKNEIEIARASRGDEIEILNLDYQKIVGGDDEENILLQDQDVVMIKKKTEFFESPLFITISGEVKYAGTYALKSRKERASSLIKRAGGVTDLAYLKGTVFTRERKHLVTKEQQKDLASSNKVFDLINTFEYERQLARNRFLWQKEQEPDDPLPLSSMGSAPVVSAGADTSKAAAISMAPATAEGVGRTVEGVMDSIGDLPSVVSRARKLGENDLRTSDRIIVEMEKVLSNPGQGEDLILMPGDAISIPGRPATVSVVGAVMRPTSISFKKNRRPEEYINLSGGFSGDADKEQLLVLSVDGSISPARERKQIEYGDIIYVPPKVMSLDIVERIDKIIEVTKFALATTASVVVFVVLIGLF